MSAIGPRPAGRRPSDPARAREQFTVHAEATADLLLPFVQRPAGPA
ncbi:hypothetical protein ACFRMQ_40410 [Kitasatospora sp. NPDC056783]